MNLLDAYVTKIMGAAELKFGKWFLPVEADCEGWPMKSELMFATKEEADKVQVGYHFLT